MDDGCVFCKIVRGELPSYTLYEDDELLVIFDLFPSHPGNTLILTKKHVENIFELEPELGGRAFTLAVKVAKALKSAFGFEAMNVLQNNGETAGQTVRHFHIHLVQRYAGDTVCMKWETVHPSREEFDKRLAQARAALEI